MTLQRSMLKKFSTFMGSGGYRIHNIPQLYQSISQPSPPPLSPRLIPISSLCNPRFVTRLSSALIFIVICELWNASLRVCLECAVVSPELIAVKLAVWSMFLLMVLRWSWRNLYLLKTKFPQFTVMALQSSRFLILFDFTVILLYRLN